MFFCSSNKWQFNESWLWWVARLHKSKSKPKPWTWWYLIENWSQCYFILLTSSSFTWIEERGNLNETIVQLLPFNGCFTVKYTLRRKMLIADVLNILYRQHLITKRYHFEWLLFSLPSPNELTNRIIQSVSKTEVQRSNF